MTDPANGFRLAHELDGTSYTVRENLVDILERELLGPRDGPEELLPVSPRQLYLVGAIAPEQLAEDRADPAHAEDAGELLSGVRAGGDGQRGVPVEAVDEPGMDAVDDDAEDRAPQQGLIFPATMGLRFQLPSDLAGFTVTASWGTYASVSTGEKDRQGRPVRGYRRTPVEIGEAFAIADLTPGRTTRRPLTGQVCLLVDSYRDARSGRVLVEVALCNDRATPPTIPVGEWLFQTRLRVDAGGAAVFLPVRDECAQDLPEPDDELRQLRLQYRDRLEFAIGRTCSVGWRVAPGERRATAVWTSWLPGAETPQTRARAVEGALLGMDALARATPDQVRAGLAPLVDGYREWLDGEAATAAALPAHLRGLADDLVREARDGAARRLATGLAHVVTDPEAFACFRFMNEVMRDQRIHTQISALRGSDPALSYQDARQRVADGEQREPSSWHPFQLAFILMQLPALTDPTSQARSGDRARVELLFFPTGGGKTEAYLGLAAYTFAIRRRQAVVSSSEGLLTGQDGVAVLMRYTLRLLTAQQFQRATTLVCAAELARRRDEATWGGEPFRIGLWVGTDVSPKRWEEAEEQLTQDRGHRLTVRQVQRCPWCGTPIGAKNMRAEKADRRVYVWCGDDLGRCPFAKGGEVAEGLPVLTVDEEIYRLPPAFLIATVDKFARIAREGEAASLFGHVGQRCGRHGYVHPDYRGCDITTGHRAEGGLPAATVRPVGRLRPPDLIIQDELHLLTGALGTTVGLFEVAVETLCSWETPEGTPVRPMIVASTATVRRADDQVRGLYGRRVEIFPPQVLDAGDTYFARELPVGRDRPGRRYLGVCAPGVRLSSAEIRVAEVLLLAGQLLLDRAGKAADPYLTLVGYFNATRELAGMARYLADEVQDRVRQPGRGSGFPRRPLPYGRLTTGELTARIASSEIGRSLDRLALEFDPSYARTAAVRERVARAAPAELPFDVVLATSMLQVGVDVQRLGLMLVVGQPKNTAEYIQATSRIGRDPGRPGLVVVLGNWARPRDLAHFEQFRHYHETFYSQVEALSVTPFSPTALQRGIDGVLVSAARVGQGHRADGLSPERSAGRVREEADQLAALVARLEARILVAAQLAERTEQARLRLANRLDHWRRRADQAAKRSQGLAYERIGEDKRYLPLLTSPEHARASAGAPDRAPFVVANSMREVQPEINLLVSPVPERLFVAEPDDAPQWVFPAEEDRA